jgi:TatA/E family protein of Tat protein translocase
MEFLGIGPMELLLILVIALLIFGPDRLPEIGAGLGKAIREFREMSQGITDEINQEMKGASAPIRELQEDVKELVDLSPNVEPAAEPEESADSLPSEEQSPAT